MIVQSSWFIYYSSFKISIYVFLTKLKLQLQDLNHIAYDNILSMTQLASTATSYIYIIGNSHYNEFLGIELFRETKTTMLFKL